MSRWTLVLVAAGLAVLALVSFGAWYLDRPTVLRIAVARDSDEHQLMTAIAGVMAREHESIRLRIVPTDGAARAAAAVENEKENVDLAVVRTDIDMPKAAQTVAILQRSVVAIIAPGGADITQLADLRGKRIGVVVTHPGGVANVRLLDLLLARNDALETVEKITLRAGDVPAAFAEKRIDAVVSVGSTSSSGLSDLVNAVAAVNAGGPVFVPVQEARALAQIYPMFEAADIPRGSFGGAAPRPATDVQTIGVTTRLVAKTKLNNDTVGELLRILFVKRQLIAAVTPLANRMEAPSTEKGLPLPVHPGAAAYLDGEEESFLDKYSDFIYLGAMLLSVLASAAAALASRLSAANHAKAEELLRALLEHLSAARGATSLRQLDALERDADRVLADALETSSLRHFDTHKVTALGLAMDQVRLAIRDRRATLERDGLSEVDKPRFLAG
jgi:TRAP transporter TAXI family solute receptor